MKYAIALSKFVLSSMLLAQSKPSKEHDGLYSHSLKSLAKTFTQLRVLGEGAKGIKNGFTSMDADWYYLLQMAKA